MQLQDIGARAPTNLRRYTNLDRSLSLLDDFIITNPFAMRK